MSIGVFFGGGGGSNKRGGVGPRGADGQPGRPGQNGRDGKDGAPGRDGVNGIRFVGAWAKGVHYKTGDVVGYEGSSYVATKDNHNVKPTDRKTWAVLAAQGARGATGLTGLTRNIRGGGGGTSAPGLIWRGAYDNAVAYTSRDAVSYLGSSYICVVATTGHLPTDTAYWDVLAAGGTGGGGGGSGLVWLGAWSGATNYAIGDAVESGGSSYIALANNTNDLPPSANWSLLAAKGDDGAPGMDGTDGVDGIDGMDGSAGADGIDAGIKMSYSTDVTNSDPGSGFLKFDTLTFASISNFMISATDGDGASLSNLLTFLGGSTSITKAYVILRKDSSNYLMFRITSDHTTHGSWQEFACAELTVVGTLANNDVLRMTWYTNGDKGTTGATGSAGTNGTNGTNGSDGATGATGATGADGLSAGLKYTYLTDVANSDPGSGKLKFDNATFASITTLRINETDGNSNAMATFIQSWDDSTSAVRGHLVMTKDGAPGTIAIFTISGSVTDAGSYDNVTVALVTTSGTFSNNDIVRLQFIRTGDGVNNNAIYNETPTGTVNGTNPTFTLASTPASGLLALFVNGQLQTSGVDYTLSSATITFQSGSIPLTGDILIANYLTANGIGSNYTSPLTTKGDIASFSTVNARTGVGSDGTVLTADSSKATGLDWKVPQGYDTVFQPMCRVAGAGNAAFATTGRVFAMYLGKAKAAYTQAIVLYHKVASVSITLTWGEVAIATGAFVLGQAASLTTKGFLDESAHFTQNGAGDLTATISLSGISPGDDIWVLMGRVGGSVTLNMLSRDSQTVDNIVDGMTQTSASLRPSTMAANSVFTLGSNGQLVPMMAVQFS